MIGREESSGGGGVHVLSGRTAGARGPPPRVPTSIHSPPSLIQYRLNIKVIAQLGAEGIWMDVLYCTVYAQTDLCFGSPAERKESSSNPLHPPSSSYLSGLAVKVTGSGDPQF